MDFDKIGTSGLMGGNSAKNNHFIAGFKQFLLLEAAFA